jgi:LPXTG-site transpeptidase (sortase) family protein
LFAIGVLLLGFCLMTVWGSELYENAAARNFDKDLRIRGSGERASLGAVAPTVTIPVIRRNGDVVGKLEIPRLNVSVMVVEGADTSDLRHALGHVTGTALPGEPGNVGIAGHRDTFFRPLRLIQRNDEIVLRTLGGTYRYRVVSTSMVQPGDVSVLDPTEIDTLTLVTCYPFYYVGPAPQRFIVRAERVHGDGLQDSKPTI